MRSIPGQGNALETEPSFDDAACCPFESFYRANRNEKQPDCQYHYAYLPVLRICCTFDTKKYKVPRGRRPRLTADQKAANNISRRLRSVLFATQQHLEIPATGAVPGPPFPQNQSLFSALEPDLRLLVWWSREKSLPLKVICSNR